MELFLIRHAHAVDAKEDAARPLSDRGRKQARQLAKFLGAGGAFRPAAFWHSSLARSQETARLLARGLRRKVPLVEMSGREPDDAPAAILRQLRGGNDPLAIVGHEPHLSGLASLLVGGRADAPVFVLRKCAVIALEGAGARWQVRWHLSPELLA